MHLLSGWLSVIFCYNVRELRARWIEWNNMRSFELGFWSVKSISNLSILLKKSVFYSLSLIVGKYIILWIPQAALSTNCWSMMLSVWEKGVSSCTEVLGEFMFSIHFSKYLDLGFLGQMQSFALLYRKLLNCFICIHAHNVGAFCCTNLQSEHQLLYSAMWAWCYQV